MRISLNCRPTTALFIENSWWSTHTLGTISGKKNSVRVNSEKEMAIHSSILAWKNPWTEESGGLKSMGLHD